MDNSLILLASIALPIVLSIILVSVLLNRSVKLTALRNTIALHSSDGLARQGLFWLVMLVPLLYFLIFGWMVWRGHSPALNVDGFKEFVRITTLPLGLLSLSIPLTALVSKLHSTAQAAKQIQLAEVKNNHDLFYLHRREYVAFFQQVGEVNFLGEFTASFKINPRVHSRFFEGDVTEGIPRVREDFVDGLISDLKLARACLADVIVDLHPDQSHCLYIDFCQKIVHLMLHFGIQDMRSQLRERSVMMPFYDVNNVKHAQISIGATTQQAVAAYRCVKGYLLTSLEFAGYRKGIEELKLGEVDFVDISSGYLTVNRRDLVVERIINDVKLANELE